MYTVIYIYLFHGPWFSVILARPRKGKAEMGLGRALDAAQGFHQGLQLAPEPQARHGVTRGAGDGRNPKKNMGDNEDGCFMDV